MAQKLLPIAAMEKILKEFGADRVSLKAKKTLKEELERYAADISQRAVRFASHAGRRTVKKEDIKLASKE